MEISKETKRMLIEELKAEGYTIEEPVLKRQKTLKPYFGAVKTVKMGAKPIGWWQGHYGILENGSIVLCTRDGHRIDCGTLITVNSSGDGFALVAGVNVESGFQLDPLGRLVLK